jgi:type VI secretion system protein ImpB|eukprot:TRINITY_DN4408_c0_g1_i1.p1 TRINITY_DN4408_c0_g1~~TRINITY_DN4408_c0_g1_i1.p1  ORF type:complete len:130 (-),score=13.50 TRINITY_DN4408_c0_g1_i1:413-802(-)
MGDFSGDNTEALKPLKDRRFIQIDRENFNDVLKRMSPSLKLVVENTLSDDDSEFEVNLSFKSIDDFEPAAVVNQVEPLRKLMETRNKLRDLMTKIDRSEELENVLEEVLSNTSSLDSIAKELKLEETEK